MKKPTETNLEMSENLNEFMEEALIEAKKSLYEFSEVPVGCVFVLNNQIIARGHNLVNETKNATRHAEFVCIDKVLEFCKSNDKDASEIFQEISVIVTVEPCIMCAAALYDLKVKEISYGCRNDRFGGSTVLDVAEIVQTNTKLEGGFRESEAMDLLKEFYKGQNPAAPVPKDKRK